MRTLTLTAAHVAKVQRIEPDEGPRADDVEMDDEDYLHWSNELLKHFDEGPLRVFAYGSLLWKPEFEFVKQERATLVGWHRSFCLKIERWRGTRTLPGLMMALDRGGSCNGIMFELPMENRREQLSRLLMREMSSKPSENTPRILRVNGTSQSCKAVAFTCNPGGNRYAGKLPLSDVAVILARAAGHWGSGAEYLFNTVSHLEQLGIQDRNLWELQKLVAAEIEAL
jgi:cation transport protein ChaC